MRRPGREGADASMAREILTGARTSPSGHNDTFHTLTCRSAHTNPMLIAGQSGFLRITFVMRRPTAGVKNAAARHFLAANGEQKITQLHCSIKVCKARTVFSRDARQRAA